MCNPLIRKRIREREDGSACARLTPAGEEFAIGTRLIIDAFRQSKSAKASGASKTGSLVPAAASRGIGCFRVDLKTPLLPASRWCCSKFSIGI